MSIQMSLYITVDLNCFVQDYPSDVCVRLHELSEEHVTYQIERLATKISDDSEFSEFFVNGVDECEIEEDIIDDILEYTGYDDDFFSGVESVYLCCDIQIDIDVR